MKSKQVSDVALVFLSLSLNLHSSFRRSYEACAFAHAVPPVCIVSPSSLCKPVAPSRRVQMLPRLEALLLPAPVTCFPRPLRQCFLHSRGDSCGCMSGSHRSTGALTAEGGSD